jgi:hypothetical protein
LDHAPALDQQLRVSTGQDDGSQYPSLDQDEVESYIAKRPTARKKVPMPNKNKKGKAA